MDEDFLDYLRRAKGFDEADKATIMGNMLVYLIVSLIIYLFGLRIFPTAILVGNVLFLLLFRKKFKGPYGNVFFVTGEDTFYVLIFFALALSAVSYVESGIRLIAIVGLFLSTQVGYIIFRILYARKGGYINDHSKRAPRDNFTIFGLMGLGVGRIAKPYFSNDAAFYVIGILGAILEIIFLIITLEGWIVYYYFQRLTPEKQNIVLG